MAIVLQSKGGYMSATEFGPLTKAIEETVSGDWRLRCEEMGRYIQKNVSRFGINSVGPKELPSETIGFGTYHKLPRLVAIGALVILAFGLLLSFLMFMSYQQNPSAFASSESKELLIVPMGFVLGGIALCGYALRKRSGAESMILLDRYGGVCICRSLLGIKVTHFALSDHFLRVSFLEIRHSRFTPQMNAYVALVNRATGQSSNILGVIVDREGLTYWKDFKMAANKLADKAIQ